MGTEKVDYAAILADAEAKKAALEAYIASLKTALAAGALGQMGEIPAGLPSAVSMGEPIELPRGAFLNKSVPAAIKLYLASVRKKQMSQQITAALKEGGMESTAANFETVVVGALHRLKAAGEVLRFKDGWGLTEHYPDHIRRAILQEKKPARKKAKKTAKSKSKKESGEKAQVVPITQGLEQRIATVLKAGTGKSFAAAEIAKTLDVNVAGVSLALGRMAAKQKAGKCGDGRYRAPGEVQKAG